MVPTPLDDEKVFFKNGNTKYGHLSNYYGVSKQTIVLRLYYLNKINKEEKDLKLREFELSNEIKKRKKKEKLKNSKSKGGMSSLDKKRKYEGKPYSRFMLNAYENRIISSTKFMRYLDLPIDDVDSLYDLVY